MAHRNSFHSHPMPPMDNDLSRNPQPDARMHLGNGSFLLPLDGAAHTSVLRSNDYPSSSFPNYTVSNSGPLNDPYLHHPSTVGSSQFPPPSFTQHGSSMVNPQTDFGRPAFKRKSPVMPLAFNGGNPSGYYSTGSSLNHHIASNPSQPLPLAGPQYWPMDSARIPPSYQSENLLTVGEVSERNVRSRLNHALHAEISPPFNYSSSNQPHHFHATGNSLGLSIAGQSSHIPLPIAPQGRILSSDPTFNHVVNTAVAAASFNNTVSTTMAAHPYPTQRRNTSSSLPTPHNLVSRGVGVSNIGYNQRPSSYRPSSRCPQVGFASASVGGAGPSRVESVQSSRYRRPPSMNGRNSCRNGRARNSHSRFQSFYDADSTHSGWFSEGAIMMDQPHYYDASGNFFDQHRDMRLDVDNMSYEELLALEERIGNVSTGLSEETVSSCLQETTHSSNQTDADQEEENCVICMEEYKDQDKLGRLKCRHNFHASCIKNWLLIKNSCPICKASAFGSTSKEKQT